MSLVKGKMCLCIIISCRSSTPWCRTSLAAAFVLFTPPFFPYNKKGLFLSIVVIRLPLLFSETKWLIHNVVVDWVAYDVMQRRSYSWRWRPANALHTTTYFVHFQRKRKYSAHVMLFDDLLVMQKETENNPSGTAHRSGRAGSSFSDPSRDACQT